MALVDDLERRIARTIDEIRFAINGFFRARLRELSVADGIIADTPENAAAIQATLAELQVAIHQNGYRRVIVEQLAALSQLQSDIIASAERLGISTEIQRATATRIDGLRQNAELEITKLSNDLVTRISRRLQLATGTEFRDELLEGVYSDIDAIHAYVKTVSTTNLMAFNSLIRVSQAEEAGVSYFLYHGPVDRLTREWCGHFVDRLVTPEILREHQDDWGRSKQPRPVMAYRGGWNCRHRLVPVLDEEAEQLIGDGLLGPR
jgi:hypothetical protein